MRGSGRFPERISGCLGVAILFQSPSLRGSGRFTPDRKDDTITITGFNPLHCGAVVASGCYRWNKRKALPPFQSPSLRGSGRFHLLPTRSTNGLCWFQSPSLRGSGRFHPTDAVGLGDIFVSIPFIAGQWSLQFLLACSPFWEYCFNPLHCGAVVASLTRAREVTAMLQRFNPLHCGAVVASWNLIVAFASTTTFQSPSLRGSGRFNHQ